MRYTKTATLVALTVLQAGVMFGQMTIGNYTFVSEVRSTRTQSLVTYRADLINPGLPFASATATLTSLNTTSFTTVAGQSTLNFSPVPGNGHVTASNTFTILVDRTVTFSPTFADLQWAINAVPLAPVANAGPNASATVGQTVTLDGSASTNPSGVGTLTFSWAFTGRPAGSTAILANPTAVHPTFVVDVAGNYTIALTVSNGTFNNTASVTISTTNPPPPVANAGPDQHVNQGATVVLDGSHSTSGSGNPLTFSWTLTNPSGSTAVLTGPTTVAPTFVADKPNATWTATLIVNDGIASSAPSIVHISTAIVAPVANAGTNQSVNVGATVQLNGSGSTDANGLPLTYHWTLPVKPAGSNATLSSLTIVNPTFVPDLQGTYMAQLIVNNGTFDSAPSTVTITTNTVLAPTANAGTNQTVNFGATVQLAGSGTDPQSLPLTFLWTFSGKPAGSAAVITNPTSANPTFIADKTGTFGVQLVVNNGFLSSAPSTVSISTTCSTKPTANAGPTQNVTIGNTVTLTGAASTDACSLPLTYSWSLSRPAGSAAVLTGATTVSPTFVADVAGTFVPQLIVNNGFQSSDPATVNINASAQTTITLTPNPLLVLSNGTGTLTVTLSASNPAGQAVTLSGGAGVFTMPPSVNVLANQTTATVQVTPVAPGTATLTGSASGLVSGTTTVTVINPLAFTTTSPLPNGVINVAYNATVAATGGTPAYTFTSSTLPAGLSISAAGVISGTPTGSGSTTAQITVKDTTNPQQSLTSNFVINIAPALAFTTTSPLANGVINVPYNVTMAATGGNPAYTFSSSTLPPGLSISAAGVISGTPSASGSTTAQITVKDTTTPQQSVTSNFVINIAPALAFTTTSPLANGVINVPYNVTMAATGGNPAYTFSSSTLPPGLSISAAGVISGTPSASGSTTAQITVKDTTTPQQSVTSNFVINISAALAFTTTSPLPSGVINAPYTTTVAATGGNPAYTFSSSTLPPGLSISAAGVISGTPSASGSTTAQITVKDTTTPQQSVTSNFVINIIPALAFVTTSPLPNGTVNVAYGQTISATGGTAGYTFSSSTLPAGLTISGSGFLSGTPSAAGTTTAQITVKDSSVPQQTLTSNFVITINAPAGVPVTISPVSIGKGLQGGVSLSIASPLPSDLTFTLTSSDPNTLVLNGGGAGIVSSVSVTIPSGITSVGIQAIGVNVGTTTLVASGAGTGTGNVTVTPAGFLFFAPGPSQSFNINQGQQVTLTVQIAQLDASGNVLSTSQTLAPPVPPAGTHNVTVILSNQSSAVGGLVPASAAFTPGDNAKSIVFTANSTGSGSLAADTLTANAPVNFIVPNSNQNIVSGTVNAIGCSLPATAVGKNLETNLASDGVNGYHVSLSGTVSGASTCNSAPGLCVTVTSTDTSKFLLTPDGFTTPTSSITVVAPVSGSRTPDFFIVGVGSGALGSATINANASTFGNCSNTASLTPAGFVDSASSAILTSSFSSGTNQQSSITVFAARLDNSLNFVAFQPVAPNLGAINVGLTSSNTTIGTITPSVSFAAGQVSNSSALFASGTTAGSTDLTVTQPVSPAGFSQANTNFKVTATVQANTISVCGDQRDNQINGAIHLGYHLEFGCNVFLSQPAPSLLTITLTSADASKLLLTSDPTGQSVGTTSVTVTIPQGSTQSSPYYLIAAGCPVVDGNSPMCGGANVSTGTYSVTTTGFASFTDTGSVTLVASTAAFNAFGFNVNAGSTGQAPMFLFAINPDNNQLIPENLGALPGSSTLPISIDTNNHPVATVSGATFTAGSGSTSATVTGVSHGTAVVTLTQPTGFAFSTFASFTATVN